MTDINQVAREALAQALEDAAQHLRKPSDMMVADSQVIDVSETPTTDHGHAVDLIEIRRDRGTMAIVGQGFGPGPNVLLDDQFEDGPEGDVIGLDSWSEYGTHKPQYNTTAYSDGYSMEAFTPGIGMRQFRKKFDPATEIFVSFRVRTPGYFPGAYWYKDPAKGYGSAYGGTEYAQLNTFPKDSSWKMCWLLQDGDYGQEYANLCLPSYVGSGGIFALGGNDNQLMRAGKGQDFWSWEHWNRMSTWIRAADDPLEPGNVLFQALSQDRGMYQVAGNAPIFDADGPAEKYFNSINVPGWIRPGSLSPVLYDDIYLATGPGAVSRVEAGDAAEYSQCTKLEILQTASWREDRIVVETTSLPYLYMTDSEGRVNSQGYGIGGTQ